MRTRFRRRECVWCGVWAADDSGSEVSPRLSGLRKCEKKDYKSDFITPSPDQIG